MKTKFFTLGCLIASLCFTGCNDDDEVTVKGISITPATVSAMEIGGTVELTATITPADATEEIRWVSYDPKIISITSEGSKAILRADSAGTTRVFATNKTGIVVSEEIEVKVNSAEYAGFVIGNYIGTAQVSGAINATLPGVEVTLARVGNEQAKVKLNVLTEIPDMGELTVTGDEVYVSLGAEPGTYALKGTAFLPALQLTLNVSGTFRVGDKSLTLDLEADGVILIHIEAAPGVPADYGAIVAGDYLGTAKLTGALTTDIDDIQIALTRLSNSKVSLLLLGVAPGIGALEILSDNITVSAGETENICALSGTATLPLMNFTLNVSGTYNITDHTLTLALPESGGLVNILVVAKPAGFDPSDYGAIVAGNYLGNAKLTGQMTADLSGVQVALERVDKDAVKLNLETEVPGLGKVSVVGDQVTVAEGDAPNTYRLSGAATMSGMGLTMNVTGTFDASDRTLKLQLVESNEVVNIDLEATPAPEDGPVTSPAETMAGDYKGTAQLSGAVNETISNVPVKLELVEGETGAVKFTIVAAVTGFGEMTITADELAITPGDAEGEYALSGETTMPVIGAKLNITGVYRDADHTLAITLAAEGFITIEYDGAR
ncbi:MAG: Ig-like domain-containing protein [Tannerella sp.]|jgi:hypothetical protein|nr:Ig-like domain-containing protein [Tannerella sp.]